MESITLAKAKVIAVEINAFGEKNSTMDFDKLIEFVKRKTQATRDEIITVIQFLQEIQGASETLPISDPEAQSMVDRVKKFIDTPIDLAKEIQYNYGVARALLDVIMERGNVPDSEEVRKTLREISRFSDTMLKMQERLYNVQEIMRFQERVMACIEELAPEVKEVIVAGLLEADL